jgi:hypothetical protein
LSVTSLRPFGSSMGSPKGVDQLNAAIRPYRPRF